MNRFIRINALNRLNLSKINVNKARFITHGSQRPQSESLAPQLNDKKGTNESLDEMENPLNHRDYFGVHKLFTVRDLFECRAHLGHKEGTLNEHMTRYLFGTRLGLTIFDLDQTAERLREALNFTAHLAFRGAVILFVNRSRHTGHLVEKTAKECGEYAHCREWQMGTFSDSTSFFSAVTRLPDLVIFLSTLKNVFEIHPAVEDAAKLLIPSVGIVDSNSNPTLITYPVPSNDDTYETIELYCRLFKQSILLGKAKRNEMIKKHGTIIT